MSSLAEDTKVKEDSDSSSAGVDSEKDVSTSEVEDQDFVRLDNGSSTTKQSANSLSVVIGTYHSAMAQFDVDVGRGEVSQAWVETSATRAVKTVCCNGFFAVGGGSDEMIRIVNMAQRRSVGQLYEHVSTLTALQLFRNSHLVSASEDGAIHVWEIGGVKQQLDEESKSPKQKGSSERRQRHKSKAWDTRCLLRGHKRAVVSLSIHPSGRLLLSVDCANQLKIWDLVRARCVATVAMPCAAKQIDWSPNGHTYAVVRSNKALIYTKTGLLFKVIKNYYHTAAVKALETSKLTTAQKKVAISLNTDNDIVYFCYVLHDLVAIADNCGRITVYDMDSKSVLFQLSGHTTDRDKEEEDEGEEHGSEQLEETKETTTSAGCLRRQQLARCIRGMKAVSLNGAVHLVSGDNQGRVCVYDVNQCLTGIVELTQVSTALAVSTAEMEDTAMADGSSSDEQSAVDSESDSEQLADSSEDEDSELLEAGAMGRRNAQGICEFGPLLQFETEARITSLDVALIGKLNVLYKWRRNVDMKLKRTEAEAIEETEGLPKSAKKRKADEMQASDERSTSERGKTEDGLCDSDDETVKTKKRKKRKIKKKRKPIKPAIDLSRFD